ncbi:MAG: hypothetical protein QOG13_1817 [Sphingomonadales bacterium]|jgi:hypothetical protein|nr:hypothetical protein [Sphingomonadales bacterium]
MRAAFATFAVTAALLGAGPAAACTMVRVDPPSRAQADRQILIWYRDAFALVEVEVVAASAGQTPGIARVVRVYKGDIAIGRELRLRGQSTAMCGAGDMVRGARGLLLLPNAEGPGYFPGFLPPDFLPTLQRHGVRAIR